MYEGHDLAAERTRRAGAASTVILVGSALDFSDQMIRILRAEFPDFSLQRAGSAQDIASLIPVLQLVIIRDSHPDLAELIAKWREREPGMRIAVACRGTDVVRRLRDGDCGKGMIPPVSFLPMDIHLDAWFSILRLLFCGEDYLPREILHAWRAEAPAHNVEASEGVGRPPAESFSDSPDEVALTRREMQVLPLLAAGQQNKCIAGKLGLSEHTVKLHTHNIFAKLKVRNRTAAAQWYYARTASGPHNDDSLA